MTARRNNLEYFGLYPACLVMVAIDHSLGFEHDTNQWKNTCSLWSLGGERYISLTSAGLSDFYITFLRNLQNIPRHCHVPLSART